MNVCVTGSLQIVIKKVNIPATVESGDEYVILDCDYDLAGTSPKGLVVKWYLNNYELVYQWIYGILPQASDLIMKYIDLDYKASSDNNTMYRAMKFVRPSIELTGNYTCQISTWQHEVTQTASMIVYSTGQEDEFKLWHTKTNGEDDDGKEVTCQALGLYPKPTLDILVEGHPELQSNKPIITESNDGYFNIVSYLTFEKDDELPDSVFVTCILRIPNVNYTATRKIIHYPQGRPTTAATIVTVSDTTKLLRQMEIQALDNSQADASSGGGNSANHVKNAFLTIFMTTGLMMFGI
uniref:Ig-like domain-containing protein n=1 Tax=Trichogramma kaykai TaxID=54128 RepID=A0ABD2W3A8_9HYME